MFEDFVAGRIAMLTAPGVGSLSWHASTPIGYRGGGSAKSDGLYVANTGQVTGDVMLCGAGGWSGCEPVGASSGGTYVPSLAPSQELTPPASFSEIVGATGQHDESDDYLSFALSRGSYAVFATCYNAAPCRA